MLSKQPRRGARIDACRSEGLSSLSNSKSKMGRKTACFYVLKTFINIRKIHKRVCGTDRRSFVGSVTGHWVYYSNTVRAT
jgi:hypothetical protein